MSDDISQQLAGASDADLLAGARLCLERQNDEVLGKILAEIATRGLELIFDGLGRATRIERRK